MAAPPLCIHFSFLPIPYAQKEHQLLFQKRLSYRHLFCIKKQKRIFLHSLYQQVKLLSTPPKDPKHQYPCRLLSTSKGNLPATRSSFKKPCADLAIPEVPHGFFMSIFHVISEGIPTRNTAKNIISASNILCFFSRLHRSFSQLIFLLKTFVAVTCTRFSVDIIPYLEFKQDTCGLCIRYALLFLRSRLFLLLVCSPRVRPYLSRIPGKPQFIFIEAARCQLLKHRESTA